MGSVGKKIKVVQEGDATKGVTFSSNSSCGPAAMGGLKGAERNNAR